MSTRGVVAGFCSLQQLVGPRSQNLPKKNLKKGENSSCIRVATGYNAPMNKTQIKFAADKNGTPLAYRYSHSAMRWFRMSYDEAQILVSTGAATVYCYKGQFPVAA